MRQSQSNEWTRSAIHRLPTSASSSTRLLYIFLALIILSTCAKIVKYIGDEKIEDNAAAVTDFNSQWMAWRTIEDSIRTSLEQIELQSLDEVTLAGNPENHALFLHRVERMQRCIRTLQAFPIPPMVATEVGDIYTSLAKLASFTDSLETAFAGLTAPFAGLTGEQVADRYRNWERNTAAVIRSLDAIRRERMAIVARVTEQLNIEFNQWQSLQAVVNSSALVIAVLVAAFGLIVARNLSRSERDRSQQFALLSESENRFRTVVANIPGVIFRAQIADNWPFEYVSDNVERITGYPASDFIANKVRSFGSIIHPADSDKIASALNNAIKHGTPYSLEYRIINATGEVVWLSERGQAIAGSDGKLRWLDGAMFDITDRKKASDRLAESEETLRALIDASPGIALLMDSDGRVLAANDVLAKRVGLKREEIIGKLGYEIVPAELMHQGWLQFRRTVESGQKLDFVQSYENSHIHICLRPIADGRGRIIRVAVFGMDVTGWNRALNESKRFKDLFDQTTDIVGMINPEYDFIYMNRACREFVGASESTPVTKLDLNKHYTPESLDLIRSVAFPTVVRDGVWQGEATLIDAGGKEIPASIVFTSHRTAQGELEFLSCIIRDLTDRKQVELELAEVSNRLHEILDAIPLPVYYKDRDLRYQGCNSAFERYFEIKEEELVGKSVYDVFPNEECDRISARDRELMGHQMELVEEGVIPTASGEIVNIQLHKAPVRNLDGTTAGLVAVGIDITERKKMEESLRQSANQLRQLTGGLPGVVYQFCLKDDGSVKFPFISDSVESIFGYSAQAITEDPSIIYRVVHPDDLMTIQNAMTRYNDPADYWSHEFRCIVRGETRWIRGSALLQNRQDRTETWNGMLIDITEQKVIEDELRISEERFRRVFDTAGFGMATVDHNCIILDSNPAFQRMVQYGAEELCGKNFLEITHPDDVAAELERIREHKHENRPLVQYEKRYIRKDGQTIWARLSVVEFSSQRGIPDHYIGLIEEITERRKTEARIRESETLYRTLFESSDEGLFLVDGAFVDCNDQASKMFKCSRSEICGRTPADFSPEFQPDGRTSDEAARQYLAAAEAGIEQSFTWRHLRKDGEEIDTEVTLKKLIISGDAIILASVRDMSERIRMETALRDSLMKLNTLVSSAVDGIILVDRDGTIESANPSAARIFETDEHQLCGRNIATLVAEPHRSQYLEVLQHSNAVFASSLIKGVHEVLGLRSGDYVFPMDIAISPLQLGDQVKYVAIIRDIAERKFAEQRIVENEARLDAILSSAGDGIVVIDGERRIQIFNDAAHVIFGRSVSAVTGLPFEELVPGFGDRAFPAKGERLSFETVGIHSEKGNFPLQLSVSHVSVGGIDSYAIIARDLTEDYERRERMMEADKMTSIGTLAAGIAHEFKNYLAGIIGNASFALDCLNEPGGVEEARDAFEQIITIGEKANEIALSLLTYSRRRQDDLELLDLEDLIRSTLRFTSKELEDKKIEIVTHFANLPKVMVSANRAQQAFLNLIINSCQAIIDGGVITISAVRTENTVVVRVGDTGIGISPENIRRIFDPFFSTKGVWGKDAVHGTGLGLSICKNIFNSFGGDITVESTVGKGTTFSVTLPIPDQEYHSPSSNQLARSSL